MTNFFITLLYHFNAILRKIRQLIHVKCCSNTLCNLLPCAKNKIGNCYATFAMRRKQNSQLLCINGSEFM